MAWRTLSLHFKQTYEGGYRYLDKCGEFMIAASQKLGYVPGDAKPTGAKLEIPEKGLNATCDANELALFQEVPGEDHTFFINASRDTSNLALSFFKPLSVLKNGFALKEYWHFPELNDMFAASRNLGGNYQEEIGKAIGMVPSFKRLDTTFASGSKEFRVYLQPVTFERTVLSKYNANSQATKTEKDRIDRRNKFADHINKNFVVSHALVLELDLTENNPPSEGSLEKHFSELEEKSEQLKKLLNVK
jgi:hypothetical protein